MVLQIKNLSVVYPDKTAAITDVSLSIARGEGVALLGANGAGKTTLLLALVGILEACNGTVDLDGLVLGKKNLRQLRQRISLIFQNPDDQLFMPLIGEDIAFGCRNMGLTEEETEKRVKAGLEQLNISHLRYRSPLKLSGGEKRLAAIATVLAMGPEILLFDEPTAYLDHQARRTLITAINSLPQAKIIATHDLAFAAEVTNRAVLLKKGSVAASGGLTLLYDKELLASCGLEALNRV